MSDEHGGKQMGAFLLKKGDYLCELALTHSKAAEYDKAHDLYRQAAGWYKKGGAIDKAREALQLANAEKEKAASTEKNP